MNAFPLFAEAITWLTPFWLLSAGATLALLILTLLAVVVYALSKKSPACLTFWKNLNVMFREGFLLPLAILVGVLTVFTIVAGLEVNYDRFLQSLVRLPFVSDLKEEVLIKAAQPEPQHVSLNVKPAELTSFKFTADREVVVKVPESGSVLITPFIRIKPDEPWQWTRDGRSENPFTHGVNHVEVRVAGEEAAHLQMELRLAVEYPEAVLMLQTAGGILALVALYIAVWYLLPKVAAIAAAACKEGMSQPLFYLVLGIGLFCLMVFVIVPYNTFGEDIKIYKMSGVVLIITLSMAVALWNSSVSIADEIEGRTAVTVLSKPVARWQFILGKFIGVAGPVILLFLMLGTFFLLANSFKTVYDARESAKEAPVWRDCYREMVTVMPGLFLGFLATMIMSAISVALSTRLPMLPNLIVCSSVYVIGYLVPQIVKGRAGRSELVNFIGQLMPAAFPVLDHFNVDAAIMRGTDVPLDYLFTSTCYAAVFCVGAMLIGLILFEDRDVA